MFEQATIVSCSPFYKTAANPSIAAPKTPIAGNATRSTPLFELELEVLPLLLVVVPAVPVPEEVADATAGSVPVVNGVAV